MQIHAVLHNTEAGPVEIGEALAGSGFENEVPETDFAADDVAPSAAEARED
jgi:hypothetical protein